MMKKLLFLIIPLIVFSFCLVQEAQAACAPGHVDNGDGTCTATFYPDASPETSSVDGDVHHYVYPNLNWAGLRAGAGYEADDTSASFYAYEFHPNKNYSGLWETLHRGIILFNTSGLPDDVTITAATLSIYGSAKADSHGWLPNVNIYSSAPASQTALAAGDFDSLGTTAFCDTPITYANWQTGTPGTANDFVLNAAGRAAISKTSVSRFGTRNANYDVSGTVPTWYADWSGASLSAWSADKGTGYKPKLVVIYTPPAVAPTITNSVGATNVIGDSARLNGEVTDAGSENPTVYIYWGDNDGGTTPGNWDHNENLGIKGAGTFYKDISGLTSGKTYYYRTYAVNSAGSDWANETTQFTTTVSCQTHNVSGWAWSENIGWISFSCKNQGTAGDYGVDIVASGTFSGYTWSENIGWISFAPAGPYPSSPDYSACLDSPGSGQTCDGAGNYTVSGWARACSVFQTGCSGVLKWGAEIGGWDGWIKLKGTAQNGSPYGVSVDKATGDFSGYAWSDMVIGWISFQGIATNGNIYKVKTTLSFNSLPDTPTQDSPTTWDHCIFLGKSIPTFHWTYVDPDGDPQTAYNIEVDDNSSFQTPKFNHLVNSAGTSYTLDLNQDDEGDWLTALDWNATYFWRVQVKDDHGNWSAWSNPNQFKTPKEAYPYSGFFWEPLDPNQGEVVVFTPDDLGLSYLWTVTVGSATYVDSTGPTSQNPHIIFGSRVNKITLQVTDGSYSCTSAEYEISAALPLPEYKEVPPLIWLQKALGSLVDFFHAF